MGLDKIPLAKESPVDDLMYLYGISSAMIKLCVDGGGVGLSAVQVGLPFNLFVVCVRGFVDILVNCSYEGVGEKMNSMEGCLSIKDSEEKIKTFEVKRFPAIRLVGKRLLVSVDSSEPIVLNVDEQVSGIRAVICQHEIDHASGILISDIGKQIYIQRN